MLPSNARLTRAQHAETLADAEIRTVFNKIGTLKFTKNLYNKGFSVVLSKKHEKSAVKRNKIKRQIYTLIRTLHTPISFTGTLYLSKNAYIMEFEQLKNYLNDLLAKTQKNP